MTSKNQSLTSPKSTPKKHLLQIFSYICIAVLFVNISCSRQITEPVDDSTPGRRDYVWTVDTIKIPFNLLQRIWGSSPTDVWAVGPGGGLDQTIWHYDGTKWKTDGISRNIAPWSVFGFTSNDVWICGDEGKVWHYNGANWSESVHYKQNGCVIYFEDLWGMSGNDMYAIGFADSSKVRQSIILHYNGRSWSKCDIPLFNYQLNRIKGFDNNGNKSIAMLGYKDVESTNPKSGLFIYNGLMALRLIYEGVDNLQTGAICQNIKNELFFTIGNTINTYSGSSFHRFLQVTDSQFGGQIFGRSRKDIFIRMFDGIAHYNGTDIQYLYKFTGNISIRDATVFDNEVFFLASDLTNDFDIIYHGRLKNLGE